MTSALDAMVKAMRAELDRQEGDGLVRDAHQGKANEVYLDATIDLEKVARAGLEAVRTPTQDMIEAGLKADLAGKPFEGAGASEHWAAMIDRMLETKS